MPIEELAEHIEDPWRNIVLQILTENKRLFETARGSTHNHQAWPGGYIDHVVEVMNLVFYLYHTLLFLGRPLPFSLSDALLVCFLHDLEKPWRILVLADGSVINRPGCETKADFKRRRDEVLASYGLMLTAAQANALKYVEGEGDDYSSKRRVMNELAALCHMADLCSARIFPDHPKAGGADEWTGAGRFRTT